MQKVGLPRLPHYQVHNFKIIQFKLLTIFIWKAFTTGIWAICLKIKSVTKLLQSQNIASSSSSLCNRICSTTGSNHYGNYHFSHLTCRIFIKTTSSLAWSVPTNRAWVTASAMFSIPSAVPSWLGSEEQNKRCVTEQPSTVYHLCGETSTWRYCVFSFPNLCDLHWGDLTRT